MVLYSLEKGRIGNMKKRIRMLAGFIAAMFFVMEGMLVMAYVLAEEPETQVQVAKEEKCLDADEVLTKVVTFRATSFPQDTESHSVSARLKRFEHEKRELMEEAKEMKADPARIMPDGSYFYPYLEYYIEHINEYFSEQEINETTLMIMGENGHAPAGQVANKKGLEMPPEENWKYSATIISAHAWNVVDRINRPGFSEAKSVHDVIYSGAYDAVTLYPENMSRTPDPLIREIVIETFARSVFEKIGAPAELVGRTVPYEYPFFRVSGEPGDPYNHFYSDWQGGKEYNPFNAPYNPYWT